jgi:hypothetical protein
MTFRHVFLFSELYLILTANHRLIGPILSRKRGTLATSLTLGQAAVDALVSRDGGTGAYGEIVWS